MVKMESPESVHYGPTYMQEIKFFLVELSQGNDIYVQALSLRRGFDQDLSEKGGGT